MNTDKTLQKYESPGSSLILLCPEDIVCNDSGSGREDLGDLGDTPTWDPED